jgi:hypothetical protein
MRSASLVGLVVVAAAAWPIGYRGRGDPVVTSPVAKPSARRAPTKSLRAEAPTSVAAPGDAPSAAATSPPARPTSIFLRGGNVALPDRVLHGRVIDERGTAAPGATVSLVSCWLPRQVVWDLLDFDNGQDAFDLSYPHMESETTTDADGRFELPFRGDGDRTLRVRRGDASEAIVDGPQDGCVVRLPGERPTLAVRVVRADDGTPVLGARVRVEQSELGALRGGVGPSHAAETDADGRCRVDGALAAGPACVVVKADGFAFWSRDPVEFAGATSLVVSLSTGAVVEGRVVDDETGATVSGARLAHDVVSDGAGRFRVEHFVGTRIDAYTTSRWDWRTAESSEGETPVVVVDGVARDVEIRLRRPAELAVRCVDASGAPIRGVIVAPSCGGAEPTGADGKARLRGAHLVGRRDDLRLTFYVDGVGVLERAVSSLASGETRDLGDVVLAPPK